MKKARLRAFRLIVARDGDEALMKEGREQGLKYLMNVYKAKRITTYQITKE